MNAFEIPWVEPEAAFRRLIDEQHLAFLDSAAHGDRRAAVSYLCLDPRAIFQIDLGMPDCFGALAAWMAVQTRAGDVAPDDWPFEFAGGAVGWLGYDLGVAMAGLKTRFDPVPGLPGGWFGLYDTVFGFDLTARRAWLLLGSRAGVAVDNRLAALLSRFEGAQIAETPRVPQSPLAWQPEMSRDAYDHRLDRLRDYIAAGDIYQANLTLRFTAARPAGLSTGALYSSLRALSPAPFAAYIGGDDGVAMISASPERFLRLTRDGLAETRPIKGTIARQADPARDAEAAMALLASPKERAENLMIVDLLRNDLGQVCKIGSVAVPELFSVESYAQAHHLVSAVAGRLRSGLGAFDLLRACFPGGSITGAPKRRAMEIIDELEMAPRGAYCGSVVWIGFDGAMDSSIIIRSIVATRARLFAQAGGGITWDSDAAAEYDEVMLKISPLLAASHG
jgi:para-aminobenzoate synthetase component 1